MLMFTARSVMVSGVAPIPARAAIAKTGNSMGVWD
jgi:hypothetical protein